MRLTSPCRRSVSCMWNTSTHCAREGRGPTPAIRSLYRPSRYYRCRPIRDTLLPRRNGMVTKSIPRGQNRNGTTVALHHAQMPRLGEVRRGHPRRSPSRGRCNVASDRGKQPCPTHHSSGIWRFGFCRQRYTIGAEHRPRDLSFFLVTDVDNYSLLSVLLLLPMCLKSACFNVPNTYLTTAYCIFKRVHNRKSLNVLFCVQQNWYWRIGANGLHKWP